MGWHKDGSGLDVKRARGMTLNYAFVRCARGLNAPRETKRSSVGYLSEVDLSLCAIRMAREKRRDRRAKRLAKAAARRLDTLPRLRWRGGERVLVIPPEVLRAYLKPGRHERMREADHALGS